MNDRAAASAASSRVGDDVGRLHRARDVHGQDDRRVLARDGDDHRRPGEADEQRGDRAEVEDRRQVAAPRRSARREVGEQVQVREADRVARCGGAGPRGRTRSRPGRGAGRGAARERGRSCGSSCACRGPAKPRASAGSHGPRWRVGGGGCRAGGTPRPRRALGRPRRPSSKAVRSRRSPVSTRSVRPVSGSMRVSSPTSTSASSRGSVTSRAMTAWRPATSVSGRQPVARAAEVGDDRRRRRPVVRDRADECAGRGPARSGRRLPRAARLASAPEQAEHPAAAAGRRRRRSRGRPRR